MLLSHFQFLLGNILKQCERFGKGDVFFEACKRGELEANDQKYTRKYVGRSIYAINRRNGVVERYNTETDAWEVLQDIHCGRSHFSAAIFGDEIYLIGSERLDTNKVSLHRTASISYQFIYIIRLG